MKILSIVLISLFLFGLFSFSGCYTQLMTPQEMTEAQQERKVIHSDASSSLNYNQNCYSCHSQAELEDRYIEWKYYGITTAHNGIAVNPMSWNSPYSPPIYEPDPYGWYNPVPSQPWWLPPAVIVTAPSTPTSTITTETENRTRTEGATRDPKGQNTRTEPIPAQSQPQRSVDPNTTTNTNPSTNTNTTTQSTTVTTQQPAQSSNTTSATERPRNDNATSNTNRTRDEGATRDNRRR